MTMKMPSLPRHPQLLHQIQPINQPLAVAVDLDQRALAVGAVPTNNGGLGGSSAEGHAKRQLQISGPRLAGRHRQGARARVDCVEPAPAPGFSFADCGLKLDGGQEATSQPPQPAPSQQQTPPQPQQP